MQVLEKILEEIEEATFQEDAPVYIGDVEVDGYVRVSRVEEIIRSHMDEVENDGWIPVKREYPEPGTEVLCSFDDGRVETLWQNWKEDESGLVYFELGDEEKEGGIKKAVAWKPLPEPYKPERDNDGA